MLRRASVLAFTLALVSLSLAAQTDVGIWASRASLSSTTTDGGDIHFGRANGWGVSANHYWRHNVSTELAATWLRVDGNLRFAGTDALSLGRVKVTPITLALQWHVAPHTGFDPYIGAGAAYVHTSNFSSSDLTSAGIGEVSIKNKTTWLGNVGANMGDWNHLSIALDAKYIHYRPDGTANGSAVKLKLDPVIVSAGVKFRW